MRGFGENDCRNKGIKKGVPARHSQLTSFVFQQAILRLD